MRSLEAKACDGVPQDSVLRPLLPLVFINNLTVAIKLPCFPSDDVKVMGDPASIDTQSALDTIHMRTYNWELLLNVRESNQLIHGGTTVPRRPS